jgi:signal peptidase I
LKAAFTVYLRWGYLNNSRSNFRDKLKSLTEGFILLVVFAQVTYILMYILIALFAAIYGKLKGFGRFWLTWILGATVVGPIPILLFFMIGKPKERRKKLLPIIIFCLVALFVQVILIRTFIQQKYYLVSESMSPAIETGDSVMAYKLWYHLPFVSPKRGQIVVFKYPADTKRDFCHRLIGLPGDKVEIRGGRVSINDHEIAEPYVQFPDNFTMPQVIVPYDNYFVLGDNRAHSIDSRYFGFVKSDLIQGPVLYRCWPLSRIGWII